MEKQEEKPDKETLKAWMNDPANIRWGIFYYNPKDKRLFPAKRYGLGWTVNFANRNSILAMVTVVIIIILINYFFIK